MFLLFAEKSSAADEASLPKPRNVGFTSSTCILVTIVSEAPVLTQLLVIIGVVQVTPTLELVEITDVLVVEITQSVVVAEAATAAPVVVESAPFDDDVAVTVVLAVDADGLETEDVVGGNEPATEVVSGGELDVEGSVVTASVRGCCPTVLACCSLCRRVVTPETKIIFNVSRPGF